MNSFKIHWNHLTYTKDAFCYSTTTKDYYYYFKWKKFQLLQSWTTQTRLIECMSFLTRPKEQWKKNKAFLLLLFWVILSSFELKSSIPNWCKKLKLAPRAFFNTTSQGPRFNSKSSISIGAKVEISPQGLFYTRSSKIYWYPDINILENYGDPPFRTPAFQSGGLGGDSSQRLVLNKLVDVLLKRSHDILLTGQ